MYFLRTDIHGVFMAIINALSVNVEDYYQALAFHHTISAADWDLLTSRVEQSVDNTLVMLSDHNVKATFYLYAWTVEHFPQMVRKIVAHGHEIGCRHYSRPDETELVRTLMRQEMRADKDRLEQLTGKVIAGYRCDVKHFSFNNEWLYDELVSAGYGYNSGEGINSVIPEQWQCLDSIASPRPGFRELPISAYYSLNRQKELINANALKFRRYEGTRRLMNRYIAATGRPVVAVITSWMLDEEQPRIRADSLVQKWLHHFHLRQAPLLLHQLLAEFRWERISDVYLNKVISLKNSKRRKGKYNIR